MEKNNYLYYIHKLQTQADKMFKTLLKFTIMCLILIELLNLVHAINDKRLLVYMMTPAILISSYVTYEQTNY
jgi:hypothetical protein